MCARPSSYTYHKPRVGLLDVGYGDAVEHIWNLVVQASHPLGLLQHCGDGGVQVRLILTIPSQQQRNLHTNQ